MELRFTKMHGLGNDFVVVDSVRTPIQLSERDIRYLADRRRGVGCDQVLIVEAPRTEGADFYYRIFNADGSEVEQCGNGARCFARFVRDHGLSEKDIIDVGTMAGTIRLFIEEDGRVRVNMGPPQLDPENIPFAADRRAASYLLDVGGESVCVGAASMGNPHAVLRVEDVDRAPVSRLGPLIERDPRFPRRVNVGFLQVVDGRNVRLRVFERGVGETEACGTGACAAVVVGRIWGELDPEVDVALPGGHLTVRWDGEGEPVWMTGPAVEVFEGRIGL